MGRAGLFGHVPPAISRTTPGLTGFTVNAMALIAPGAFLWLGVFVQRACGARMAAQGMCFSILAAIILCLSLALPWRLSPFAAV